MSKPRTPRSIEAATKLLEQFAELEGQIAQIEAERAEAIAAINARADTASTDLLGRREDLRAALAPWWAEHKPRLTEGKRKSIELGGCMIGTQAGRVSLAVPGEEKAVAAKLAARDWATDLVRTKPSLDKAEILKALGGSLGARLRGMGFRRTDGAETFFIKRAEQAGTLAGDR